MGSSEESLQRCLYQDWMSLQEQELSELLKQSESLNKNVETTSSDYDETTTALIIEKIIRHFQDYVDNRRRLACRDVFAFFSPRWCTTFENSMSWIGGCRPSSFFSLIFAICGSEIESKLDQFFQDDVKSSDFPHLSASQLSSLDRLQRRTILDEEKLSSQAASLQQEMTDVPLALIARKSCPEYKLNGEVKDAIAKLEQAMVSTMEEADQLRLNTAKEIIKILTPVQALEYIISAKKLRLCVQAWGVEKDKEGGRE